MACCAAADTARPPDFARHQGEIGHRGRQIQLEFRLDPTEVAGLPDAQLDQPRQSVLHYHPSRSILVVVGALLQGPGLLQHAFLGMDQHPATLPALGRDALGAERTYPTYRPVELESLQSVDTTGAIRPLSRRHDGTGNLPRRTGATARGQVKVKVIFGEVFPVGPARRFGHQPASRVGEGLAGPAVPEAASPMASSTTEPGILARLHSAPPVPARPPDPVGSVARQHVHGRDQLAVGVHHMAEWLSSVETVVTTGVYWIPLFAAGCALVEASRAPAALGPSGAAPRACTDSIGSLDSPHPVMLTPSWPGRQGHWPYLRHPSHQPHGIPAIDSGRLVWRRYPGPTAGCATASSLLRSMSWQEQRQPGRRSIPTTPGIPIAVRYAALGSIPMGRCPAITLLHQWPPPTGAVSEHVHGRDQLAVGPPQPPCAR